MKIIVESLYTEKKKPWRFKVVEDIQVTLSNGDRICIPAGFITDFASVPRLLKGVVNSTGNHNLATLIHDYLYVTRYNVYGNDYDNRLFADKEMRYWLKKAGCSYTKRQAMYYAVRIGGKSWWKN